MRFEADRAAVLMFLFVADVVNDEVVASQLGLLWDDGRTGATILRGG